MATLNPISPCVKARNSTLNVNETCQSPHRCFKSPIHSDRRKVESILAVICFMWGTREVWKCSVVIRKDTEEEEEEEDDDEEMAEAPAMGTGMA